MFDDTALCEMLVRYLEPGGEGVGLAIAERAIRLHGGTVRAENRAGGGLEVEIRLPGDAARD